MPTRGIKTRKNTHRKESMDETVNQGTITQENAEGTQEAQKTFTQEEMNRIIADRVQRERSKYNDYDSLKEKAAKYDAHEEASKTELQKAILAFAQSNGCSEVRDGGEVRTTSRRTTAELT